MHNKELALELLFCQIYKNGNLEFGERRFLVAAFWFICMHSSSTINISERWSIKQAPVVANTIFLCKFHFHASAFVYVWHSRDNGVLTLTVTGKRKGLREEIEMAAALTFSKVSQTMKLPVSSEKNHFMKKLWSFFRLYVFSFYKLFLNVVSN